MLFAKPRYGRSLFFLSLTILVGCSEFAYRQMNAESRDDWQQPKAVVQALAIEPGNRVVDLGAGGGYFTWFLANAVGPEGLVYAVDINDTGLAMIRKEALERGVTNIQLVKAQPRDSKLTDPVDLIFTCNTYHHMDDRPDYFASLVPYLRPGGRIAIIDFNPTGWAWLFGHSTSKERVRAELEAAGYRLIQEHDFLPKQHFQVFAPPIR